MPVIVLLKISIAPSCAPFSVLVVLVTTLGKLLKNLNLMVWSLARQVFCSGKIQIKSVVPMHANAMTNYLFTFPKAK